MLIISRKVGEKLRIGDDVEIVTLAVQGNSVKIGIEAPRDVEVHREEIYLKIQSDTDTSSDNLSND